MVSGTAGREEVLFSEVQRFKQKWLWLAVIAAAASAWFAAICQLFGRNSLGGLSTLDWLILFVWLFIGLGLPALFITATLRVEVRDDGIYYRYYPFHRRFHRIASDEIEKAEARTYRPIAEYGGWGIRGGWGKSGKAYNVYGDRGVQLELVGGKRILFGSQKAGEFAAAIHNAMQRWGRRPAPS